MTYKEDKNGIYPKAYYLIHKIQKWETFNLYDYKKDIILNG